MTEVIEIDGHFGDVKEHACVFVIKEGNDVIIIEPTTNKAVPYILERMKKEGMTPEQVKYIIFTHIHLDHAGGTSLLVSKCKNAKVYCHPKSAVFLINPERLIKGCKQVFGVEKYNNVYGEIKPVDKNVVVSVKDKETLKVGPERVFTFFYTLGHATHHMIIHDNKTNSLFTGDSFGSCYKSISDDYIGNTCSPIDFNPKDSHDGIDIIEKINPSKIYLTHFGMIEGEKLKKAYKYNRQTIDDMHAISKKLPEKISQKMEKEKLIKWIENEVVECLVKSTGRNKEFLENDKRIQNDVSVNALGILVYVQRRLKKNLEI